MLNKINKEIDDFTNTIKEVKGCNEMIVYLNSSYISCVKLLIFASKTFSLYSRIILFFIIASGGLLLFSLIGAIHGSITLFLAISLFLFFIILLFVVNSKKSLILSINNKKKLMQEKV